MTYLASATLGLILAVLVIGSADAGSQFLRNLADVPLMQGMIEQPAKGLVFDTTEGRVIEAEAQGPAALEAVQVYYADALPELGWARVDATWNFRRAREILSLQIERRATGGSVIHFVLRPAAAP
jgi:hypothetical protein